MAKLIYPTEDIYNLVNEFLDEMVSKGKIEEHNDKPITRGDVGSLNLRIAEKLQEHNLHLEFQGRRR